MIDKKNLDKLKQACTFLTEVLNANDNNEISFNSPLSSYHLIASIDELISAIKDKEVTKK